MQDARRKVQLLIAAGVAAVGVAAYLFWNKSNHEVDEGSVTQTVSSDNSDATSTAPSAQSSASDSEVPPSEADLRAKSDWVRSLVVALEKQDDAASLATAALLIFSHAGYFAAVEGRRETKERQQRLLVRAAKLAPSNAAVQALALASCQDAAIETKECEVAKYEEALRRIAPENFESWLGALDSAVQSKDAAAQIRALEKMADATQFGARDTEIESMVRQAVESVRIAAPSSASGDLTRPIDALVATATGNPPVSHTGPLFYACQPSAERSVMEQCSQVSQALMSTDKLGWVDQSLRLQLGMAQRGSIEAVKIERQLNRLEWQMQSALNFYNAQGRASDFFREIKQESQLISFLEAQGISLDPPSEWRAIP